MKYILYLIPILILLSGCEERYRYPCQNPENWDNQYCKKPYCSANGTCPEDLTHYEKEKSNLNILQPKGTIGGSCK
jgi:hypothetical protein